MIVNNYRRILDSIADTAIKSGRAPEDIALLAVSKTYPAKDIAALYYAGCRHFGESRVQEASEKMAELGKLADIDFDLIGRMQTNKAKQVAGHYRLVHSVDRLALVAALEQAAARIGIVQDVLLQVSLAGELQKGGAIESDLPALFDAIMSANSLCLKGFMTIPPYDENPEISRPYFRQAKAIFDKYSTQSPAISVLSMGMSGDYKVAIEEGATMLRIGTAIFGRRT